MDWLKKILKVAKDAQEVIEEISDSVKGESDQGKDSSQSSASTATAAEDAASMSGGAAVGGGHVDSAFQQQLDAGYADPRKLLTRDEAAKLLGEPVKPVCATYLEEYICAEYRTERQGSQYVRVDVASGMPWDYLTDEVRGDAPPLDGFGDEAFERDGTLYVRSGETIFWVSGGESFSEDLARDGVRLVLAKLNG